MPTKKKTTKLSKKTKPKKAQKKKAKKRARAQKPRTQELVIRVQSAPVLPTEKDLAEPIHEGKNYAITKTWVSSKQIIRMVQRTPKEHIYTRPGKGGQKFNYVTGSYVEKVLNYVFGFLWDFEIVTHGQAGDFIWVQGKLTVKNPDGQTITKTQFGRAEIKYLRDKKHEPANYVDYGNDLKAASTDALKKCASLLGIAGDVYGKQEFKQETNIDVDKPVLPPAGAVAGPDGEPVYTCADGDEIVDEKVAEFSNKVYGRILCREHQAGAKRKK